MFCRIALFGAFMLAASNVANAQSYTITITPPAKEQAPKPQTDEDLDTGWNYSLPNQEQQFFMVGPWQRVFYYPAVARPRVWTNPKLKVKIKQSR